MSKTRSDYLNEAYAGSPVYIEKTDRLDANKVFFNTIRFTNKSRKGNDLVPLKKI